MTFWSDTDQRWHWSAVDHAGESHSGTVLTREAAETAAVMAGQRRRTDEPDQRAFAPWRTHRWSRREQRMVPNVRPRFPRLPTPPDDE